MGREVLTLLMEEEGAALSAQVRGDGSQRRTREKSSFAKLSLTCNVTLFKGRINVRSEHSDVLQTKI